MRLGELMAEQRATVGVNAGGRPLAPQLLHVTEQLGRLGMGYRILTDSPNGQRESRPPDPSQPEGHHNV